MENQDTQEVFHNTQEETDADYASRVEADKRSILEQLLTFDYDSLSNGGIPSTNAEEKKLSGKPIDESNVKATLEEEYNKIFGDIDVDNSEEIFNSLLKKVEEEFKRQMEFKKKNPFLAASLSAAEEVDLKPERRTTTKRKPKAFEQSLKVMDNFKKRLLEKPLEPDKVRSSSSDFSAMNALVKSSSKNTSTPVRSQNTSVKLKSSLKVYPKWKTTSTYTPIFSAPINPNWASIPTNIEEKLQSQKTAKKNKMLTSTPLMPTPNHLGLPRTMNLSKMYTSTQIRNWIHTRQEGDDKFKANNDAQLLSSSNKTFRSDQSVCNSELNNDVFSSPKKSPLDSSSSSTSLVRDTVVRFRPSPPECFLFSSNGNSSISSSPSVIDYENIGGEGINDDFNDCEYLSEEFVYYENGVNEQAGADHFNANYSDSPDNYMRNCPENYYPVKLPVYRQEQQKFVNNFNEGYHNCCNSRHQANESGKRVLNRNSKPPIPSADFIRNLQYNININYNIINNCN